MKFVCPKCRCPLEICDTGAAKCKNNHSFDRSREGYYNLLLANGGANHGDNREMLLARRRFLDTESYRPLAEAVCASLRDFPTPDADILDMGAGEGYYTDFVERAFSSREIYAFDISKEAVRLAAKRNKRVKYAVASSYKVPLPDESFGAIYNIFSPLAIDEVKRLLKKDGIFVVAIPDSEHLFSLKAAVYDEPYKNTPENEELQGFLLEDRKTLSYSRTLSGDEARDLFMMTPYAYRTSLREKERLLDIESLEVGFRFIILTYKKL